MVLSARGRSTFIEWVSTGTVMMKIISNTSMTSTRGVMLISLMTSSLSSSPPPNAILARLFLGGFSGFEFGYRITVTGFAAGWRSTGNEVSVQLMCKTVELAQNTFITPIQGVIAQYCRNRDGQAESRHDQRLANRACHLVDARRTRNPDPHQRVVDAPHSAKQTDEGSGGAYRSQHRQSSLQALCAFVDGAAQAGGKPFTQGQVAVEI